MADAKGSKHEYICEGCHKVSPDYECIAYTFVPSYYIRQGVCPLNPPVVKKKVDVRKRVGQQKGYAGKR
jgi:hypothetical protein